MFRALPTRLLSTDYCALEEEVVLKIMSAFRLSIAVVSVALCADVANLQAAPTQAQQNAIRSSCQTDYRTYCASVPTGGAEALQCLQKNVASLSPSCQQAVQAVSGGGAATAAPKSGTAPAATAPAASVKPPAATAPASTGPVVIVLQPGQEIAVMRQACGADYRAHCNGVRIIGGGALSCLVANSASLSASCKGALGKLGQRF